MKPLEWQIGKRKLPKWHPGKAKTQRSRQRTTWMLMPTARILEILTYPASSIVHHVPDLGRMSREESSLRPWQMNVCIHMLNDNSTKWRIVQEVTSRRNSHKGRRVWRDFPLGIIESHCIAADGRLGCVSVYSTILFCFFLKWIWGSLSLNAAWTNTLLSRGNTCDGKCLFCFTTNLVRAFPPPTTTQTNALAHTYTDDGVFSVCFPRCGLGS